MKKLLIAMLFLFPALAYCQPQKSIIIHTNAHAYNYFNNKAIKSLDIGFLSASYQIQKKKFRWSYELAKLNFNREEVGHTQTFDLNGQIIPSPIIAITTLQTCMRIMCSKNLGTHKTYVPYLGFGLQGTFASKNSNPFSSNNYPSNTRMAQLTSLALLGLKYNISKRIFLDAQSLISVIALSYNRENILNPALTNEEQQVELINVQCLNQEYFFRLGIGFNL